MTAVVRAGLVPHSYVLTTRGRRTGAMRRCPVTLVQQEGRQWLVAPYGAMSWVHNARAAGQVQLTRRWTTRTYSVRELSRQDAGPVLQRYVQVAAAARPYFRAQRGDPVERFVAEAQHHPVLELTAAPAAERG